MMQGTDPNNRGRKIFGPRPGGVVDNRDPMGLGRIRVSVPGVYAKSPWALPLGTLGAGPGVGGWWIPKEGSEVVLLFSHGDPDHPYYLTSNWTVGSVPDEAVVGGKGDPDIRVIASGDYAVVFDESGPGSKFSIIHRPSGDVIEHDGLTRRWRVNATVGITLEAVGEIQINGTIVTINGRTVLPSPEPI